MADCGCGHVGSSGSGGPYASGRELVEFVSQAHGGGLRDRAIPGGGLPNHCQGCGHRFVLETFVGCCPACGGVHAVSPPRCDDPRNIQFAGVDFVLG